MNKAELKKNIDLFTQCKSIAFVGVSNNKLKVGYSLYQELIKTSIKVIPVNPNYTEIDGNICFPNLSSIPQKVDGVFIITPKNTTEEIVKEAIKLQYDKIWIQWKAETPNAIDIAQKSGIHLVHNRCIMMFTNHVSRFHKVHKFFFNIFH